MNVATPRIRRASPADAAALANLGRRIFAATFAADNRPEDMATYLDATYGPEQQEREIADPALVYYVVEADDQLAGYALLRSGTCPSAVVTPRPLEIVRFYVDTPWHGSGVAQILMDRCVSEGRERGATALWLGVWERNARAIRFYEKAGFRDVGAQSFLLGSDVQTDRVMVRSL